MLNIAIDYDGTIDADPIFWKKFIKLAKLSGHNPYIVTYRDEREDRTPAIREFEEIVPVYYTCGVSKRHHLEHIERLEKDQLPHIWIDDRPKTIDNNGPLTEEELAEWRKVRQ